MTEYEELLQIIHEFRNIFSIVRGSISFIGDPNYTVKMKDRSIACADRGDVSIAALERLARRLRGPSDTGITVL